MKNITIITSLALLFLYTNAKSQLTVSPLELMVSVEEYVSIVAPENRVPAGGLTPLTQSVPINLSFQDFGKIDSIYYGIHFLQGISTSDNDILNLNGFYFQNESFEFYNRTIHYLLRNDEENKVTIEFVIPCRKNDTAEILSFSYQIIFDELNETFSYHYGTDPTPFLQHEDVYFSGVSLETLAGDDYVWFNFLFGEPESPLIAKTIEDLDDFNYLSELPQKGTKYTFSNLITSIGEQSILNKTRLEKTSNGYRIFSEDNSLTVSLIDLNGKRISEAKQYGDNYFFIDTVGLHSEGLYIIRLENAKGESAGYKIQI